MNYLKQWILIIQGIFQKMNDLHSGEKYFYSKLVKGRG